MSGVLVVLGVLSVVARGDATGFVADFKPFEHFLEPVFSSEFTRHVTQVPIAHYTELTFSILAIGMAVAGWFLARLDVSGSRC